MIPFNQYMKNKIIFSYEITRACNLRCSYCYALSYLDQNITHDNDMADLVIEKIAKFKQQYPDWHFELDILGGDPLSAPNIFEFLDKILALDIEVWIVTNLIPSDQSKIVRLKEYLKYPKFGIAATWHDEIGNKKDQKFKDNLLFFKDSIRDYYSISQDMMYQNVMVSFVLFDGNGRMYDKAKWLVDNNTWYGFTHLYTDHKRVQKYVDFSDEAKWVFENAVHHNNKYFLGDRLLSPEEFEEGEYYQIAHKYHTICEPLNFHIGFYGQVISSCKYLPKITYNIKDEDIVPKRVFCKGYDCYCSVLGYKELYGEKNAKESDTDNNARRKKIIPIANATSRPNISNWS